MTPAVSADPLFYSMVMIVVIIFITIIFMMLASGCSPVSPCGLSDMENPSERMNTVFHGLALLIHWRIYNYILDRPTLIIWPIYKTTELTVMGINEPTRNDSSPSKE